MKIKSAEEYRLEYLSKLSPQQREEQEKRAREAAQIAERNQQEMLLERQRREKLYRHLYLQEHSIPMFLEHSQMLCRDPEGKITSRELYAIYSLWCKGEDVLPKSSRSLLLYLKEHALELHLLPINGITNGSGKRVRGFRGIRAAKPAYIPEPSAATDAAHI